MKRISDREVYVDQKLKSLWCKKANPVTRRGNQIPSHQRYRYNQLTDLTV